MCVKSFTVLDFLKLSSKEYSLFNILCLAGRNGLANSILLPDVNRPGLALSGFFEGFAHQRVQLFGMDEYAYLKMLEKSGNFDNVEKIMHMKIPCCVFSNSLVPPAYFLQLAEKYHCPVLQSPLNSSTLALRMIRLFSDVFAETVTVPGVLVEVFGLGMLITGSSGVGKSETALELIERGHILVADDVVQISCSNGNMLVGRRINTKTGHLMEIRGLGIININRLYGVGSVRENKQVEIIVELEEWVAGKAYDRLGVDTQTREILGVTIPYLQIPVKPGRNIPIIIETAAKNERLKSMGYFAASEFGQNVLSKSVSTHKRYYDEHDTY